LTAIVEFQISISYQQITWCPSESTTFLGGENVKFSLVGKLKNDQKLYICQSHM